MKRILITGANSYVGMSVEKYLSRWPELYRVDTVDMIDGSWRDSCFGKYDVVFHVAGIVHRADTKDDPAQYSLYEQVNAHLAAETARKAREEGVGQFVFMSTEGVYGLVAPLGKTVMITRETPAAPVDNYGKSKLLAEEMLQQLETDAFGIAILRPPMIYGKGCKGNYCSMAKLAEKLPVFPRVGNCRSMLYIDNFSEFFRLIVEDEARGIFCPQNSEYVNTSDMVEKIAQAKGRKIAMIPGVSWALHLLRPFTGIVDKAFGSLCYDQSLSTYSKDYCVMDFETSILETES